MRLHRPFRYTTMKIESYNVMILKEVGGLMSPRSGFVQQVVQHRFATLHLDAQTARAS